MEPVLRIPIFFARVGRKPRHEVSSWMISLTRGSLASSEGSWVDSAFGPKKFHCVAEETFSGPVHDSLGQLSIIVFQIPLREECFHDQS